MNMQTPWANLNLIYTGRDDYEFTLTLELSDLNDAEADCAFSADEYGTCRLEGITIINRTFRASEIAEWFGKSEVDRLTAIAQKWWVVDGGWEDADRNARRDAIDD